MNLIFSEDRIFIADTNFLINTFREVIYVLSTCLIAIKILGDHSVEVKINENHIEGSPFLLKAYDASRVKVADVNSGIVGKPVFFSSK